MDIRYIDNKNNERTYFFGFELEPKSAESVCELLNSGCKLGQNQIQILANEQTNYFDAELNLVITHREKQFLEYGAVSIKNIDEEILQFLKEKEVPIKENTILVMDIAEALVKNEIDKKRRLY